MNQKIVCTGRRREVAANISASLILAVASEDTLADYISALRVSQDST